jgi:hypothetical protein
MNAKNKIHRLVHDWHDSGFRPVRHTVPQAAPPGHTQPDFRNLCETLEYLNRAKFERYVPTLYSKHPIAFFERLYNWLQNESLTEENRQTLFEFASHLAYFSFDDFVSMYRSAFSGSIARWTVDQAGISMDQDQWSNRLHEERFDRNWYCPVTDSMLISVFHHVNGITGKGRRPAFRELMEFPNIEKIKKHLQDYELTRLVLLEDFVGTGHQTLKTIKWAVESLQIPVLFCPMIASTEACVLFREYGSTLELPCNFTIAPVLEMDSDCFVHCVDTHDDVLCNSVVNLAERLHAEMEAAGVKFSDGPLGHWRSHSPEKGAMVVLFSNTPNNTVNLVHHDSPQWKPLFPRITREFP